MKKILIIALLISLFIIGIANSFDIGFILAIDEFDRTPTDESFTVNKDGNLSLMCSVSPHNNYTLVNISFWTNTTGSWIQASNSSNFSDSNGTKGTAWANFTDLAEYQVVNWGCIVQLNATEITSYNVTSNWTTTIRIPPTVVLLNPSNNDRDSEREVNFNITSRSVVGGDTEYFCHIWDNSSGSWRERDLGYRVLNSTNSTVGTNLAHQFDNEGEFIYNIECEEKFNNLVSSFLTNVTNRSITIDTTDPVITILGPADNSYSNNDDVTTASVQVNVTVTDNNNVNCSLKVNGTVNNTGSYSGGGVNFSLGFNASEGRHNWSIFCNDTVGRTSETENRTITIDTSGANITQFSNYSTPNSCGSWTFEFNSTEEVNATFTYGLSSMAQTHTLIDTNFARNHTFNLTFNNTYETTYYINVSVCDRAGTCNGTSTDYSEMLQDSPIMLCTGWSIWSVYDSSISFDSYFNASAADFLYRWNNTGQSWAFYSLASTTRADLNLIYGDAAYLFTSTNESYFRNKSRFQVNPYYIINITAGDAYFGIYDDYTFGNLSNGTFTNRTGGSLTSNISNFYLRGPTSANNTGGLRFNFTWFYTYNNSAHSWMGYTAGFLENNNTAIGTNTKNGNDILWTYAEHNVTVNFSTSGAIIGNWT